MALHEKELLEALSSSRILTAMITPAVLISACGTLIFSTASRLGRIFDRVNVMKEEVEEIYPCNPTSLARFRQDGRLRSIIPLSTQ